MDITGEIIEIFDEYAPSDKFKKREFVIQTEGEYGQPILFEFHQDKCSVLEGYSIGDRVEVNFNLKGRLWEKEGDKRYFNTLQAWKINKVNPFADS